MCFGFIYIFLYALCGCDVWFLYISYLGLFVFSLVEGVTARARGIAGDPCPVAPSEKAFQQIVQRIVFNGFFCLFITIYFNIILTIRKTVVTSIITVLFCAKSLWFISFYNTLCYIIHCFIINIIQRQHLNVLDLFKLRLDRVFISLCYLFRWRFGSRGNIDFFWLFLVIIYRLQQKHWAYSTFRCGLAI